MVIASPITKDRTSELPLCAERTFAEEMALYKEALGLIPTPLGAPGHKYASRAIGAGAAKLSRP
jgi:hypothetical protein